MRGWPPTSGRSCAATGSSRATSSPCCSPRGQLPARAERADSTPPVLQQTSRRPSVSQPRGGGTLTHQLDAEAMRGSPGREPGYDLGAPDDRTEALTTRRPLMTSSSSKPPPPPPGRGPACPDPDSSGYTGGAGKQYDPEQQLKDLRKKAQEADTAIK